jgi:hypothetical protein
MSDIQGVFAAIRMSVAAKNRFYAAQGRALVADRLAQHASDVLIATNNTTVAAHHNGEAPRSWSEFALLQQNLREATCNGHRLIASQADATVTMLAVAAGDMDEAELAT